MQSDQVRDIPSEQAAPVGEAMSEAVDQRRR